jgi:hypothetical protein
MRHFAAAVLVASLLVTTALACPFCPSAEQTLLNETSQAHFVVFGAMTNAVRDPNEFGRGTTDLAVEVVVKDHEFLKGKKTLVLPRYVPPDPKNKSKHLVFFELFQGKLDPYRGVQVDSDSKVADYLKGLYQVKDKPVSEKLNYCFGYFDSTDWIISGDAFQEFSNSDYKDVRAAALKMDPAKIVAMLKDPNTSTIRYGLLGMLLGHCGQKQHLDALKAIVEDPKLKSITGLDGLLAGLILLDPKDGLAFVGKLMTNEKEDFLVRYAALRSMRFFWEYRPDVVTQDKILASIDPLVNQPDITDLVIEDLRKWLRWEKAAQLIALFDKPTHNSSIVQRSIIKFALCASAEKKDPAVDAFLVKIKNDPEQADRLKDLVELIELEKPRPVEKKPDMKKESGK